MLLKEQPIRLIVFGAITAHFIYSISKSEYWTASWIFNIFFSFLGVLLCISELIFAWQCLFYLPNGTIGYIPFVGEMIEFTKSPNTYFISRLERFQSPFLTHIYATPAIQMASDEDVAWLWNAERKGLARPGWPVSFLKCFGRTSLIMAHGARHRHLRRLLEPAFTPSAVKNYVDGMDETIQTFLDGLYKHQQKQSSTGQQQYKMSTAIFRKFALQLLFVTIFGKDIISDDEINQLQRDTAEIFVGLGSIFPRLTFVPGTQIHASMKARAKVLKMVRSMIRNFKETYDAQSVEAKTTLMGRLCYGNDNEGHIPLSVEEMSEQLLVIFFAGHDTTYATIGNIFYFLSLHPDVMQALEHEVNTTSFANAGGSLDFEAIKKKTPIMTAIMKEAWRIEPPGAMSFKKMNQDTSYKGYMFPKDTSVCYNISLGCYDKKHYPDPHEFRIERFLEPDHPYVVEKQRRQGNQDINVVAGTGIECSQRNINYRVFGGGNHSCLGVHFAQLELRIFMIRLIQQYSFHVDNSEHRAFPVQHMVSEFYLTKKKGGIQNK